MSQLSRPVQLALGAVLLLALVGVVGMRLHANNPSEPVPASSPAPRATAHVAPRATEHVAPRTTARVTPKTTEHASPKSSISRRAAPAASARRARAHSAQPTVKSHESDSRSSSIASADVHKTVAGSHRPTVVAHKVSANPRAPHSRSDPRPATSSARAKGAEQAAVQNELAQGKTVLLLFWNPSSTVDREVLGQATALAASSKGAVVLHPALASQVNEFGAITEVARVYQTPTILIVNHRGVVSTLTGLTDTYALAQAVSEAQSATR